MPETDSTQGKAPEACNCKNNTERGNTCANSHIGAHVDAFRIPERMTRHYWAPGWFSLEGKHRGRHVTWFQVRWFRPWRGLVDSSRRVVAAGVRNGGRSRIRSEIGAQRLGFGLE